MHRDTQTDFERNIGTKNIDRERQTHIQRQIKTHRGRKTHIQRYINSKTGRDTKRHKQRETQANTERHMHIWGDT